MFRPDCKASRVIFRTGSKKQPPMKGSPAIGTRLLNGLELKHQSRFGLDCLNDHSIAEDLSRLLVERTSRGVEAFNYTRWAILYETFRPRTSNYRAAKRSES